MNSESESSAVRFALYVFSTETHHTRHKTHDVFLS